MAKLAVERWVILAVVTLLVVGAGACTAGPGPRAATSPTPGGPPAAAISQPTPTTAATSQGATPVAYPGDIAADLVQAVQTSVVKVMASGEFRVAPFGRLQTQQITGTGFVIDPRGFIVTNAHVLTLDNGQVAPRLQVQVWDGRHYDAALAGTDPSTDLAVLRIAATDLPALRFADPASIRVGQTVVAIGYALNLGSTPTVTLGVISAKDRVIEEDSTRISGAIQTDAAINPGNSGGPLLNMRGEVVGINTAGLSGGTQPVQGIFFAISAQVARPVVERLITNSRVERVAYGSTMLARHPPFTPRSCLLPGRSPEAAGYC
jgi:S1-C subfamily serine protease